jgi:hypothetical protein
MHKSTPNRDTKLRARVSRPDQSSLSDVIGRSRTLLAAA